MTNTQLAQKSKLNSMLDHAPRVRAQQEMEAELAAIEELEQRTAPLIWMVYAVTFAVVLIIAVDGWQRYAREYAEMAAMNEALLQCINGRTFSLGDAILRCEVTSYKLVEGLKP